MNIIFGMPTFGAIQELLGIVLVAIWLISWLIRTIQANNQQMPVPVNRPGRRREERIDDEIDSFLQQVNRNPQNRPVEAARADAIPRNRPAVPGRTTTPVISQRQRKQTPRQSKSPEQDQVTAATPASTRSSIANSDRMASANLGSGVSAHTQEYMSERVARAAKTEIGQDVKQSVDSHLGTSLGGTMIGVGTDSEKRDKCTPSATGVSTVDDMRCCLRSPQSVRQAIIVQEILTRRKFRR